MTVLLLAPSPNELGGVGRVTRLLRDILGDLHRPENVFLIGLVDELHVPRGKSSRLGSWRKIAFTIRAMRRAKEVGASMVIACHPNLAVVSFLCHVSSGSHWAVWCHGREVWGKPSRVRRALLRRSDLLFTHARFTADILEKRLHLEPGTVRVCPPAVTPELRLYEKPNCSRTGVLTVARLQPSDSYKGVDTLLYSWPRVLEKVPHARLSVVGDGADKRRLESIVLVLGLSSRVHFLGSLTDESLASVYRRARIFALPSRTSFDPIPQGEGFGLVFLEAGAAGLPVVAARGGAVSEVVFHLENGLLVEAEEESQVAEAIVSLLINDELAARLGNFGKRKTAAEFSSEAFRLRIQALFEGLTSEPENPKET